VVLGYFPLLMWAAVLSAAVGIYDVTLVKVSQTAGLPMLGWVTAQCAESCKSTISVLLILWM